MATNTLDFQFLYQMVTVTYTEHDTEHAVGEIVYVLHQNTLGSFGWLPKEAIWKDQDSLSSGSGDGTIKEKYEGDEQLVIDISQVGMKARDIKWLSIWWRDYQISFGHVEFFMLVYKLLCFAVNYEQHYTGHCVSKKL